MNMLEYTIYFIPVLIGFIFGEILLQSNRHMTAKWRWDREGVFTCLEHTVLYTASIMASLYVFCSISPLNMSVLCSIFLGHFIIEKFHCTQFWMTYMKMERSPLYFYFTRKLGQPAMDSNEWINYALSLPELSQNENETNAGIFYLHEYMVVSRTLQFTVTFITAMVLGWLGYI